MTDRKDLDRVLSKMGYSHPQEEIPKNIVSSPYMTYQESGKETYVNTNSTNTYATFDDSKLQKEKKEKNN